MTAWSARIKIEVVCALGLALWDRLGAEIEQKEEQPHG